jgi:hypothetical protein
MWFDAFASCPRLVKAGVQHYWGKIEQQPNRVGPKVIWQPRRLNNQAPRQPRYGVQLPDPQTGQKREYTGQAKQDCLVGIDVTLIAEENGKLDGWGLFVLYALAAAEVVRIEADYSFNGEVVPRDATSTATETVNCQLVVRIPIAELVPHALPTDDNVSLQ